MCRICPIFTPPKRQKSWGRSISQHNREVRDCAYMIIDRWLDRGSFLQQCKLVYKPHPNLDIDIETSCFPKWGDPNHPNFVLKPMVLGIAHFKKHPCLIMYDHICAVNSIMWEPTCDGFIAKSLLADGAAKDDIRRFIVDAVLPESHENLIYIYI